MNAPESPRPRRSPMAAFYLLVAVILAGGGALLAWQLRLGAERVGQAVDLGLAPEALNRVPGISDGRPDAPVVLREFSDFQCPACAMYAQAITPRLRERFLRDGTLRYVHYDFPLPSLHPNAHRAAVAGRCANEQGRFWPYHDILYREQRRWGVEADPSTLFVRYAGQAGADGAALRACLTSGRHDEEIRRSKRFGEELGVTATPTLVLNGRRLPESISVTQLERMIKDEARGARSGGPAPR
ncbi:MAG TPA: thioredoxin domain-containing protein [Longimicrobium sp.]|nr:thioredoxin domain-containing protein [Longimicrobium sp.]